MDTIPKLFWKRLEKMSLDEEWIFKIFFLTSRDHESPRMTHERYRVISGHLRQYQNPKSSKFLNGIFHWMILVSKLLFFGLKNVRLPWTQHKE